MRNILFLLVAASLLVSSCTTSRKITRGNAYERDFAAGNNLVGKTIAQIKKANAGFAVDSVIQHDGAVIYTFSQKIYVSSPFKSAYEDFDRNYLCVHDTCEKIELHGSWEAMESVVYYNKKHCQITSSNHAWVDESNNVLITYGISPQCGHTVVTYQKKPLTNVL